MLTINSIKPIFPINITIVDVDETFYLRLMLFIDKNASYIFNFIKIRKITINEIIDKLKIEPFDVIFINNELINNKYVQQIVKESTNNNLITIALIEDKFNYNVESLTQQKIQAIVDRRKTDFPFIFKQLLNLKEFNSINNNKNNEMDLVELYNLTKKELQIITLVREGKTYINISENLGTSINTIRFHMKNIFFKMEIKNKTELINIFIN
jgi:DNA-binding CsgD family transcriptional regulator